MRKQYYCISSSFNTVEAFEEFAKLHGAELVGQNNFLVPPENLLPNVVSMKHSSVDAVLIQKGILSSSELLYAQRMLGSRRLYEVG